MSTRIFWTDERLQRVGVALLIALIIACCFRYVTDSEGTSALKRGDFPGIISPAIIIAEGQEQRLYDSTLHHEIQSKIWPSFADEMYISVYPPFFGVLLLPLAHFEPATARTIWTLLSIVCYLAGMYLMRPASTALQGHFLFVAVSFLLFAPVLFGVLGGQNSAFSLLLFIAAVRLLQRPSSRAEFFSGVLFGLWLFKPQFGVLAGCCLVLTRRTTAFLGFFLVACLYWLIAANVLGTNWISLWLEATRNFAAINFEINDYQMASFAGFLSTLSRTGFFSSSVVFPLSLALSAALLVFVWKGKVRTAWMLGPVAILISPQTLFYDLSIALVSCLPWVNFKSDREVNTYLLCGLGTGLLFAARSYCPIALPFAVAMAAFWFVYRQRLEMKPA